MVMRAMPDDEPEDSEDIRNYTGHLVDEERDGL